ncbi:MAG: ABC transporter substrate-binding protein [Acidimicrobiia bacterium]
MIESSKRHLLKFVALLAVLAMIAAACGGDTTDTTEAEGGDTTTTTEGESGDTTTTEGEDGGDEGGEPSAGGTYAMGMTSDITTTNYWTYLGDGASGTVYAQYVNAPTVRGLYGIDLPSLAVVPDLAVAGPPPEPVEGDGGWTVTVELTPDQTWSDGSPLDANDVVFTYETSRDLGLSGTWLTMYPYADTQSPQLLSVEATNDLTVVYTFSERPGLGTWPHNVGVNAIMSDEYWGPIVEEAKGTDDPVATLYGADGVGAVSAGSLILNNYEQGAFVESVANENYGLSGQATTVFDSGGVNIDGTDYGDVSGEVIAEYTTGPFVDNVTYSIYSDQNLAVTALIEGEIDYWINPLGIGTGLREQVLNAEGITTIANPTNGMRYAAFNLNKSPFSYVEFRQALALMVDKEFLTQNVLQGVAFPMYLMVPEGNAKWFNEELAEEIKSQYVGKSTQDRLTEAVQLLKDAGFTWSGEEPSFDEELNVVRNGSGLTDPEGVAVEDIEVLAPAASYDPLRSTASLWIETWLEMLGAPATANPTDFNTLVAKAYTIDENGVGDFDMYLLGWSLGNAAFPTFHESFWHSRNSLNNNPDGNNAPQYQSEEFDAAADAIINAATEEEAFEAMSEAERLLATDLPYIVLFDTPITESFNSELNFPFTSTLSGLQFGSGFPGVVSK